MINTYKTSLTNNGVYELLNEEGIIEKFLSTYVEKPETGYTELSEVYTGLKSEEDKASGDKKKILEKKIKLLFLKFFSGQYKSFSDKVKSEESYLKKISSLAKQVNKNNINIKYLSSDAQKLVPILESFNSTSVENTINTVYNKASRDIESLTNEIKSLEEKVKVKEQEKASKNQQNNPKSSQQQRQLNRNARSGDTTKQQQSLNFDQDRQSSSSTQDKSTESKEEKQSDSQSSEVEDSEKSDSQQETPEGLKKSFFYKLNNDKNAVKEIVEFACEGLKRHRSELQYEFNEQSVIDKESLQLIYNLVVYCSQHNSGTFPPLKLQSILSKNYLDEIVEVAENEEPIFNKEDLISAFTTTNMTKFTGTQSNLQDLINDLTS